MPDPAPTSPVTRGRMLVRCLLPAAFALTLAAGCGGDDDGSIPSSGERESTTTTAAPDPEASTTTTTTADGAG